MKHNPKAIEAAAEALWNAFECMSGIKIDTLPHDERERILSEAEVCITAYFDKLLELGEAEVGSRAKRGSDKIEDYIIIKTGEP